MRRRILTERVNLMEPNVYITMLVTLTGELTEQELMEAVRLAYSQNESTISRVALEENGDAFYEKMPETGCRVVMDERPWQSIVAESEKQPFAIDRGELIRSYIHVTPGTSTLLIMAHHLAGDGKSILLLIEHILHNLAGEALAYEPMLVMDEEFLRNREWFPGALTRYLNRINRKWARSGRYFTWEDYRKQHNAYWARHSSDISVDTYGAQELDEMRQAAKDMGVTLNSYLITRLLQVHPEVPRVGIPVSVREDNASMSNQVGGIQIHYSYKPHRSFAENARAVHKHIYRELKNPRKKYFALSFVARLMPGITDAVLLWAHGHFHDSLAEKMGKLMFYGEESRVDLGVTNLTRIDIPADWERFFVTDIVFVPPRTSYTKQVVGVNTFGDRLHISYHGMKEIF